jgi:hypothetical protein
MEKQNNPKVVVSPHPVKERIMLDVNGNEIDPKTKKIVRRAEEIK